MTTVQLVAVEDEVEAQAVAVATNVEEEKDGCGSRLISSLASATSEWGNTVMHTACLVAYIVTINLFHINMPHGLYLRYDWFTPTYNVSSTLTPTPSGMYMVPELHVLFSNATSLFYYVSAPVLGALILIYSWAVLMGPEGVCCCCRPARGGGEKASTSYANLLSEAAAEEDKVIERLNEKCASGEGYGYVFRFLSNCIIYVYLGPITMYLLGFKSAYLATYSIASFIVLAIVFGTADLAMSELRVRIDADADWMQTPLLSSGIPVLCAILGCTLASMATPAYSALTSGAVIPADILLMFWMFAADIVAETVSFLLSIALIFPHAAWSVENQPFYSSSVKIRVKVQFFNALLTMYKCGFVCAYVMVLRRYAFGTLNATVVL